jgi:hypothetical protein
MGEAVRYWIWINVFTFGIPALLVGAYEAIDRWRRRSDSGSTW